MSLPNVSTLYERLNKGSEGGNEFSRVMNQLLIADGRNRNYEVITSSDASGDYKGVDCIIKYPGVNADTSDYTGVQYKFFPSSLSPSHKHEIKVSLVKAIKQFPEMSNWILITPEDLQKRDMEWLDTLKVEFEYGPSSIEESIELHFKKQRGEHVRNFLRIHHWGHAVIVSLMNEYYEIGKFYYPESFIEQTGKLVLCGVSIDSTQTNWHKTDEINFIVQDHLKEHSSKSSELVFDFLFANNSPNINHLHQIDIVIEKCWTEIKGFSSKELVKSIGNLCVDIDFSQQVTSIRLDETEGGYLIFKANESRRFGIQLNKFVKRCHGNMAQLHFKFIFDNLAIKSETYTLSF